MLLAHLHSHQAPSFRCLFMGSFRKRPSSSTPVETSSSGRWGRGALSLHSNSVLSAFPPSPFSFSSSLWQWEAMLIHLTPNLFIPWGTIEGEVRALRSLGFHLCHLSEQGKAALLLSLLFVVLISNADTWQFYSLQLGSAPDTGIHTGYRPTTYICSLPSHRAGALRPQRCSRGRV